MNTAEVAALLTFIRTFDARMTVGKPETMAWHMALERVPATAARDAVVNYYGSPQDSSTIVPRIMPGHIVAHFRANYQSGTGRMLQPPPSAPASPEHVAQCKAMVQAAVGKAAARWALAAQQAQDPDEVPRWRPGMDKRKLALAQVEACRRRRALGGVEAEEAPRP